VALEGLGLEADFDREVGELFVGNPGMQLPDSVFVNLLFDLLHKFFHPGHVAGATNYDWGDPLDNFRNDLLLDGPGRFAGLGRDSNDGLVDPTYGAAHGGIEVVLNAVVRAALEAAGNLRPAIADFVHHAAEGLLFLQGPLVSVDGRVQVVHPPLPALLARPVVL
jgi:hypothetical protein